MIHLDNPARTRPLDQPNNALVSAENTVREVGLSVMASNRFPHESQPVGQPGRGEAVVSQELAGADQDPRFVLVVVADRR